MSQASALSDAFIRAGLSLDSTGLSIDLNNPRTIPVYGINSLTGEEKYYLLKVTQSGKLILI